MPRAVWWCRVADPRGFLTTPRKTPPRRPVDVRLQDWREVYEPADPELIIAQAGRCMDCGVPFCQNGCPLGNRIPDWNDLVWRDRWREAIDQLHATNNFPEFTGRLCPAPCEAACVLNIAPGISDPVTIKSVEQSIIDRAWAEGWVGPQPPVSKTTHRIAVVGSGPAGLAAAQQLTRVGHQVTVFERDDRIGGLLRYGIPDFKMEKHHVDLRVTQMRAEGTAFVTSCDVGVDLTVPELRESFDAVVLAAGALAGRELPIPGRELVGVHMAMPYLTAGNRAVAGDGPVPPELDAAGRHVVIIGGGDTAADCLGTAHRQGAASVRQLDIHPRPPTVPHPSTPWPTWPLFYREYPAHEEGGERVFAVTTRRFIDNGDGHVVGLELAPLLEQTASGRSVRDGSTGEPFTVPCDLALLAIGFAGPDCPTLIQDLGVETDGRNHVLRDRDYMTSQPGVFVAGDMGRGASLIVWAIAEGRAAAATADAWLNGATNLPKPLPADAAALR
jgi:glutamate synthase (NADPH) small chain